MSFFSVSRRLPLAAKLRRSSLATITDPSDCYSIQVVASEMRPHLKALLVRYIPGLERVPLCQGRSFIPTWKSMPSGAWYKRLLRKSGDSSGKSLRRFARLTSIFHCLPYELAAFTFLMNYVHSKGEQYSQGCLWPSFTRYAFDPHNKVLTQWCLEWFERRLGPLLPGPDDLGVPPNTGRLCCSYPGDGKRRVFAIGHYVNQRLLAPVHQWLASLLKQADPHGWDL